MSLPALLRCALVAVCIAVLPAETMINPVPCAVEWVELFDPAAKPVLDPPQFNDLTEPPIADCVAHRSIKVVFKPVARFAGKQVKWTYTAIRERGTLPTAGTHTTHLEKVTGFAFVPGTGIATLTANATSVVRINMPPIGFNQARIRVESVDDPACFREALFKVPAVVVIDPGHGGTAMVGGSSANNATSPTGVLEKNLTLIMATLIKGGLDASGRDIKTILTRTTDINLGLTARANIARDNGADIFLSIHFNGSPQHTANGTETLVRPAGNDQVNRPADAAMALRINTAVVGVVGQANRGVKDQVLGVLRDTSLGNTATCATTRGALTEMEFIDNVVGDTFFNTAPNAVANRQSVADAVRTAIIADLDAQP